MANKVRTNVTLDPELKRKAVELFGEYGIDLSTAVNLFLGYCVKENAFPFELRSKEYQKKTLKAIKEFEQMKLNKKKYKRCETVDELFKDCGVCTK